MEKSSRSSGQPPKSIRDPDTIPMHLSEGILSKHAPKSHESPTNSYLRVFRYNDTIGWITSAIAFLSMVAAGVLLPLMNFLFGKFVTVFNNFITGRQTADDFRSAINHYTLYFVYLFIAKFVLAYIWTTIVSINAIRLTCALRLDFFKQTLRQEIGHFDSSETGSISSSINTGGNLINQGISEKLGLTVQATTTFFAAFVVAFAVQWKLTLITLCIVPAILLVITICVMIDAGIENKLVATWAEANMLAEEVFASIQSVHAFWAHPRLSQKFEGILQDARRIGRKKSPLYAVMFCIQFFCIYAGYGLAFWQGIRMYSRGDITEPGDVVTVILAVLLAAQGLTQIAPQAMVVAKATAAARDLFKTIDRESKIDALSAEGSRPSNCGGDIVFDDVTFAYPSRPNVEVLNRLNLVIPSNKTTAIVGSSGSGKSTIVGLLERWFSPQSGTITLDGRKIEDVNIQWLRTNIRLVQQEPVLFTGSIFQNVAWGLSGTPQAGLPDGEKFERVEQACKAAYAHEFVEKLPKRYHTQIGERGAMLSGGQKQRLAIARSIISNPCVLLLDEATSALDANAERIVQQALNNVAVGRTMAVIAHRLSTIRNADNIVVMSKGTIVEQGSHSDLMELGGAYSRLVLAQDLGHGRSTGEEDEREATAEGHGEKMAFTKTNSATGRPGGDVPSTSTLNYNLLQCLAIIIREQKQLWPQFAIIGLAAAIGGGTYPALAILFSHVLDAFALSGDAMLQRGDYFSLMFFVMALGNLLAYGVLGWMSAIVSQEIINYYRLDIFNNIIRQELAFFDDPDNTTGALVSRLSTESTALQDLLSSNIALILTIIVNLISSCVLAIAYGWKLGLVLAFGALPPLVASGYVRIRLESKLEDSTASRFANSAGIASEAVLAIRTVASLALEGEILAKYEESLRSTTNSVKSLLSTMFWYSLSQSISFLAMALGFWYGGRLISFREYTSQQFYTVFIAVVFSGEAAAALFTYTSSITKARGAANYIFNLRRQVSDDMKDAHPPGNENSGSGAVAVECKNLEFSYPRRPGVRVLRGVSLSIRPGQYAALVGASGSGKTTMLSLLERFYEPDSGTIHLGGPDGPGLGPGPGHRGQHRRAMALVPQEPTLYRGSLRDNIMLGLAADQDDNDEQQQQQRILEACRRVQLGPLVASLPDGLATRCGPRGLLLSGGQRQRVALARALVRRPRLLLLDEATSSLDGEAERAVRAALEEVVEETAAAAVRGNGGCTTVAVAHRLATVRGADVIFVFSSGRVVEVGRHDELVGRRGVYYHMCVAQALDQ